MELAVLGRSPRGGLVLSDNLFIVLYALRLKLIKPMFWTVSSHRVRLLFSSLVIKELTPRSVAVPVEAWVFWKRSLHFFVPTWFIYIV